MFQRLTRLRSDLLRRYLGQEEIGDGEAHRLRAVGRQGRQADEQTVAQRRGIGEHGAQARRIERGGTVNQTGGGTGEAQIDRLCGAISRWGIETQDLFARRSAPAKTHGAGPAKRLRRGDNTIRSRLCARLALDPKLPVEREHQRLDARRALRIRAEIAAGQILHPCGFHFGTFGHGSPKIDTGIVQVASVLDHGGPVYCTRIEIVGLVDRPERAEDAHRERDVQTAFLYRTGDDLGGALLETALVERGLEPLRCAGQAGSPGSVEAGFAVDVRDVGDRQPQSHDLVLCRARQKVEIGSQVTGVRGVCERRGEIVGADSACGQGQVPCQFLLVFPDDGAAFGECERIRVDQTIENAAVHGDEPTLAGNRHRAARLPRRGDREVSHRCRGRRGQLSAQHRHAFPRRLLETDHVASAGIPSGDPAPLLDQERVRTVDLPARAPGLRQGTIQHGKRGVRANRPLGRSSRARAVETRTGRGGHGLQDLPFGAGQRACPRTAQTELEGCDGIACPASGLTVDWSRIEPARVQRGLDARGIACDLGFGQRGVGGARSLRFRPCGNVYGHVADGPAAAPDPDVQHHAAATVERSLRRRTYRPARQQRRHGRTSFPNRKDPVHRITGLPLTEAMHIGPILGQDRGRIRKHHARGVAAVDRSYLGPICFHERLRSGHGRQKCHEQRGACRHQSIGHPLSPPKMRP